MNAPRGNGEQPEVIDADAYIASGAPVNLLTLARPTREDDMVIHNCDGALMAWGRKLPEKDERGYLPVCLYFLSAEGQTPSVWINRSPTGSACDFVPFLEFIMAGNDRPLQRIRTPRLNRVIKFGGCTFWSPERIVSQCGIPIDRRVAFKKALQRKVHGQAARISGGIRFYDPTHGDVRLLIEAYRSIH